LLALLQNRTNKSPLPVYLHKDAFIEKLAVVSMPGVHIEKPIGMRASKNDYESAGAAFNTVSGFFGVTDSIAAISDIKRPGGWKTWDGRLKQKTEAGIIDDPFRDDLSLLIETESGPVVLLGCAHAGIVEILDDLAESSGRSEFHAVIGGTHLESAPEEYVVRAIETLKKYNVKKIAASHCTGFRVACRFAAEFRERFANASAGAVFEF
ncbi:MAG TPA: MBL fold metallo-hydrolase, partial [Spirochaetota bacterium]|nr:MBL fold metallo-hydrolase [Spirochaetota bacterium]